MQDEPRPVLERRRARHVEPSPVARVRLGEDLAERGPELPARAGDQDAALVPFRQDRRCRAPEIGDARVVPGNLVLVRVGGVVLLGHVVDEDEVGQGLEAVRAAPGHVDRDRVLVSDVLGERLAGLEVEDDDPRRAARDRRRDRPGLARGSGDRGSRPAREKETFVCFIGFSSKLARWISKNQPRSSSKRRSGMRRRPSITCWRRSGGRSR